MTLLEFLIWYFEGQPHSWLVNELVKREMEEDTEYGRAWWSNYAQSFSVEIVD